MELRDEVVAGIVYFDRIPCPDPERVKARLDDAPGSDAPLAIEVVEVRVGAPSVNVPVVAVKSSVTQVESPLAGISVISRVSGSFEDSSVHGRDSCFRYVAFVVVKYNLLTSMPRWARAEAMLPML